MPTTMARIMFGFASVFAMAYFWTLEGELITRLLLLQSPASQRENIRILIAEVQDKINGYFRGQLILCSVIGVLSAVAYSVIGVPNALLLGLLMAIFEAVPVVGPVLGAIPAVLMAASSAPETMPWVIAAVIGIQVAESNLLVPRVMDRAVGVNAIVSLLAIAAFGALFGITGALLAIPLAAVLQILISRLLFEPADANSASGVGEAFTPTQRHRWARLQYQTQALAQDARRQARTDDSLHDNASELILDELESIALRLDDYLAGLEVRK
ncbi:MAG: AI-2E family transporter [Anaerolineales bacterium]|nr:AI-2E family transporter [Anaerolineales bacterium]